MEELGDDQHEYSRSRNDDRDNWEQDDQDQHQQQQLGGDSNQITNLYVKDLNKEVYTIHNHSQYP